MLRSKRSLAARQREMRKRQPPRRGRGRPRLPINPDTVALLAARGLEMLEIANILGCSPNTIYKRFRPAVERGTAHLKFRLLTLVFERALDGDWRALCWQIKFRGLYGQKLPKRPRPSAAARATYGGSRRGSGRRRVLSRLAPRKAPSGAKIRRHVAEGQAVIPAISETPRAPMPPRRGWACYEVRF